MQQLHERREAWSAISCKERAKIVRELAVLAEKVRVSPLRRPPRRSFIEWLQDKVIKSTRLFAPFTISHFSCCSALRSSGQFCSGPVFAFQSLHVPLRTCERLKDHVGAHDVWNQLGRSYGHTHVCACVLWPPMCAQV